MTTVKLPRDTDHMGCDIHHLLGTPAKTALQ